MISAGEISTANATVMGGSGGAYYGSWSFLQGNLLSSTSILSATVPDGTNPYGIAFSPDGRLAYVTNHGSATVNVIDTAMNAVTNTITVGANPSGVAFSPSGTFAYVAASGSGMIYVINVATNSVASTISTTATPSAVAFSPNGTIAYVAHYTSPGTISKIYVPSNTVVNTIDVGAYPHGVAFNPSGSLAYVANYGGGVSVIDVATNGIIATIPAGVHPYGVAFNPSGTLAYVVNEGSATVNVINVASNAVVATIAVGATPYGVAFNPSGTFAFVTNYGSGTVSEIDASTDTVVKNIPVGTNPYGIGLSPSGTTMYTADYGGGVGVIVNLPETSTQRLPYSSSNGILSLTVDPISGNMISFSFNGTDYLETLSNGTIYGNWRIYGFARDNYSAGNSILLSNSLEINSALAAGGISPQNPVISKGASVLLTANASGGTPPYSYQWYTGPGCGTAIAGAVSSTYNASPSSTTTYTYLATDSATSPESACSPSDNVTVDYTSAFLEAGLPSNSSWNVIYDGVLGYQGIGTWASALQYPINDEFPGCVGYNSTIYCVGGDETTSLPINNSYYASIAQSALGGWHATAPYPLSAIAGDECVNYSSYIYCIGGLKGTAASPTNAVYYGKLSESGISSWTKSTSYPTPIYLDDCEEYAGFVYCVGGNTTTLSGYDANAVYYSRLSSSGVGNWTATSPYPTNVEVTSCAAYSGYLYCVGGYNGQPNLHRISTVYYANILASGGLGQWQQSTSYPYNIDQHKCSASGGYIYCVGGNIGNTKPTNDIFMAALSASGVGQWVESTSYPTGIENQGGCTIIQEQMYCIAGRSTGSPQSANVSFARLNAANTVEITTEIQGNFLFSVSNQSVGGIVYLPLPSSGALVSGNLQEVTFTGSATPLSAGPISPSSEVLDNGQAITLYSGASGGVQPYSYQWYTSASQGICSSLSNPILGAVSSSYQMTPSSSAYYCYAVADSASPQDTAYSSTDLVTVNPKLAAGGISPQNPVISKGASVLLTANASGGTPPYSYQWYTGPGCGTAIAGAVSSTYNASPSSTTTYTYLATDSATSPESACSPSDNVTVSRHKGRAAVRAASAPMGAAIMRWCLEADPFLTGADISIKLP